METMTEQTRLIQGAIYCRVSTEDQAEKGASLGAQKDYLLAWAVQENIEIKPENIFIDDQSGKDLNRKDLTRLRARAKEKEFSILLLYHNDRLSRNTKDILLLVEELNKAGITIRFSNFDTDLTTPEGELLFTMLSGFSQYFRKDLGRKTSLGMQKKKRDGIHIGRIGEYFERIDPKEPLTRDNVRVRPEHVDLVTCIYLAHDMGNSNREISKKYNLGEHSGHKKVSRIVEMVEWLKGGPYAIKFEYWGS